eukprot:8574216-Alexandrium_andersonii.AAC.1
MAERAMCRGAYLTGQMRSTHTARPTNVMRASALPHARALQPLSNVTHPRDWHKAVPNRSR